MVLFSYQMVSESLNSLNTYYNLGSGWHMKDSGMCGLPWMYVAVTHYVSSRTRYSEKIVCNFYIRDTSWRLSYLCGVTFHPFRIFSKVPLLIHMEVLNLHVIVLLKLWMLTPCSYFYSSAGSAGNTLSHFVKLRCRSTLWNQ